MAIQEKLSAAFKPVHLEVVNESHRHSVPPGSETHFKVFVVSTDFDGKQLVQRHRTVNQVLKEELDGPVHALSVSAITPDAWSGEGAQLTPDCRGGFGK